MSPIGLSLIRFVHSLNAVWNSGNESACFPTAIFNDFLTDFIRDCEHPFCQGAPGVLNSAIAASSNKETISFNSLSAARSYEPRSEYTFIGDPLSEINRLRASRNESVL